MSVRRTKEINGVRKVVLQKDIKNKLNRKNNEWSNIEKVVKKLDKKTRRMDWLYNQAYKLTEVNYRKKRQRKKPRKKT